MNSFSILVQLSKQMYEDIRFITENNPTQVIDEDTARIYNALLNEIKRARPSQTTLQFFSDMSPRTLKYKDALVVVGQLHKLMTLLDTGGSSVEELIRQSAEATQKQDIAPPEKKDGQEPQNKDQDQDQQEEESPETSEEQKEQKEEKKPEPYKPLISDEELYGSKAVPINQDGIVPFDLSDSD